MLPGKLSTPIYTGPVSLSGEFYEKFQSWPIDANSRHSGSRESAI